MSKAKSIHSMTGYGRGTETVAATIISVECKSLNSRYLEISCKLPRLYSPLESDFRQAVQSCLLRGRVELSITRKTAISDSSDLNLNADLKELSETKKRLSQIEKQYQSLGVTLDNQQRFELARQLINSSDQSNEEESLAELETAAVKRAVLVALNQLQKQRYDEGQRLLKDLKERLNQLALDSRILTKKAAEIPSIIRERVTERVKANLPGGNVIDESRLLQEIVLIVDKSDVTEELVRLGSHLELFNETVESGGLVGKRLDFVCQEIFRELNTLGGKSASAEIQAIVVNCKVELERIREQVQNLE